MSCHVQVTTIKDGEPDRECVIDHDDPESRRWLGKHCWWAFRNKVMIITEPTHKPVNYCPTPGTNDRGETRKAFRFGQRTESEAD